MNPSKCNAESWRLNCGCCDDVTLTCSLDEGHIGFHNYIEKGYGDNPSIIILWKYPDASDGIISTGEKNG